MSKCKYCGKPAGFFSTKHSECEEINNEGVRLINEYSSAFFVNDEPIDIFYQRIQTVAENYYLNTTEILPHVLICWGNIIKTCLLNYHANDTTKHKLFLFKNFIHKTNKLEECFGPVRITIGGHYTFYNQDLKVKYITNNMIICENNNKNIQCPDPISFKYYSKIEQLTEGALINLSNFQKEFIENIIIKELKKKVDSQKLKETLKYYKDLLLLTDTDLELYIMQGFTEYINFIVNNIKVSEVDDEYIGKIIDDFVIDTSKINKEGAYTKLTQQYILKDIEERKFPRRLDMVTDTPFNLLRGEEIIWFDFYVSLFQDTVTRHYIGGHTGMSFNIGNGVYLRAGEFKGRRMELIENKRIARGTIAFTNKHIYFHSLKKSFKIRYDKIISAVPFDDGIIIAKDGISSNPFTFKNFRWDFCL